MNSLEAGWYLSLFSPESERYWDGAQWTDNFRPTFGISKASEAVGEPELMEAPRETAVIDEGSVEHEQEFPREEIVPEQVVPEQKPWEHYSESIPDTSPDYRESPPPNTLKESLGISSPLPLVAIVTSFFLGPVGIILGHISLNHAKRMNENKSLSIVAIVLGWLTTVFNLMMFAPLIIGLTLFSTATPVDDGKDLESPLKIYEVELGP